jgi:dipeptidyl aminopeptidase/acylaminoacyl peptidase
VPSAPGAPGASRPAPAAAPTPAAPRYTIEQFLATERLQGLSLSPDGSKVLVSSDRSGVFNAFSVPVAGGDPSPLTLSSTESIYVESYFPHDERFLFRSDQGGNEITHIYLRNLDGSVRDLTPAAGAKGEFLSWAADETSFFLRTNERDARFFDVYEYGSFGRKLIFQDEVGYEDPRVSPTRRYVAVTRRQHDRDADVWLLDRQSGEMRNLTAHQGEQNNFVQDFSSDGIWLYFTSDRDSEFLALYRVDVVTGAMETVLRADWDVMDAALTRDRRHLVARVNRDARTEVRLLDAATLRQVPLPRLPDGDITTVELSRDGKRLAFYAETSSSPRDLFVHDLATGETRKLTATMSKAIDPAHLVAGEVVRFRSYDGVEVPGLLYRPHGASGAAPVPALVWVHGGPGGQSRLSYNPLIQYLANHGYAVYAINNRGSDGYGKAFKSLDDRRHGEADLDDCVASKRMLIETGWVDPQRIGIIGGSYGGYLVLAALAFRPKEFAVGVDIYGVANWVRTLESMPAWWESARQAIHRELGDPKSDRARLERISPLFNHQGIERPLLVLQGANDPRVLKVESDEMVAALRARGVPVEYLVFDDMGHGFVKKAQQERAYRAIREFLDRHLRG